MSLKDRLNTQLKLNNKAQKEAVQTTVYFSSEKEAEKFETLGVLDSLLCDDDINYISVNGAKNIYVVKNFKTHKSTTTFRDNIALENLIKKYAKNIGIELDKKNPFIEFNHQLGINVSAAIPPLSNNVSLFIKCYRDKFSSLRILSEQKSISKEIALVLEALCAIKNNILIIGERNTLKTTLLSAMAKKMPLNDRTVIMDFSCELDIEGSNISNFNFSLLKENNKKYSLLNSIYNSNPSKIFVNDPDDDILFNIIEKLSDCKNTIITLEAKDIADAIRKLVDNIVKHKKIDKVLALDIIKSAFDTIIEVKKTDTLKRKVSKIAQIEKNSLDFETKEIFYLDCLDTHQSSGITPDFLEDIKLNSLPVSANIFEADYKHTYNNNINNEKISQIEKKANIDILKKFKKELPANKDIIENEEIEPEDDIIKSIEDIDEENDIDISDLNEEEFNFLAKQTLDEITKNTLEDGKENSIEQTKDL